jgi:hypothetical protein
MRDDKFDLTVLKDLNSRANEGRGVSCVRGIISLFERGDAYGAHGWMETDHDKIHNYPEIEAELNRLWNEFPWRELGEIAIYRIGMQAQYCAPYVVEEPGKGLRFRGDWRDYHEVEIHRDDVEEFVRRVKELRSNA